MTALAVLVLVVVMGPLACLYGVDSRLVRERGWFGGPRR